MADETVTKLGAGVVLAPPDKSLTKLSGAAVLVPPDKSLTKLSAAVVLVLPDKSLTKLSAAAVLAPPPPPQPLCAGIFPDSLPGLGWSVTREPIEQTRIQRVVSGKEWRALDYPWPLRRWTLTFDFLREGPSAALGEMRTLMGFFGWAQGAADCFCFLDPEDDYATAAPMLMLNSWAPAIGDGGTLRYQLARSFQGGPSEPISAVYSLDAVYLNGADAQLSGYTWTVEDATGIITFSAELGMGVVPSADFAFYWRVRFVEDDLSFDNFMQGLWAVKRLQLVQCP